MGINFAYERKKFSEAQQKLRKEYKAAGMTDEQILASMRHGEKRMKARIGKSSLESLRLVVKTTLSFSWSAMKKSAKS